MENFVFNFNLIHESVIGDNGIKYSATEKYSDLIDNAVNKMKEFKKDGINFLSHPFIDNLFEDILEYSKELKEKFDNLVVVGIGGSSLGTEALYTEFKEKYYHDFDKKGKKLYFVDNYDSRLVEYLIPNLNIEKTVFLVISKSGSTLETMAPYFYIKDIVTSKYGLDFFKERLVFITDKEKGQLNILNKELNVKKFIVPANVGGRFSIFTSVSMLAATFIDIDITKLNEGVKKASEDFFNLNYNQNPFVKYSLIQYIYDAQRDFSSMVTLFYNDRFIKFSEWLRQLWGESLGKTKDGKSFGTTPIAFRGSTDQHSQLQQFIEGKNDKIYTVLSCKEEGKYKFKKPELEKFSYIESYDFNELLNAAKEGTIKSLVEKKRPVIEIELKKVSEFEFGYLHQFFMICTALTGYMFGINPFDQPGVEQGKIYTVDILKSK